MSNGVSDSAAPVLCCLLNMSRCSYLVVRLELAQLHAQLEPQERRRADRLDVEQLAQRHQVVVLQRVQRDLVLEQLRVPEDLLRRRRDSRAPDL